MIVSRIGLTVFSIKAYSNHSEEGKARRESLDPHGPDFVKRRLSGPQDGRERVMPSRLSRPDLGVKIIEAQNGK